MALVSMTWPEYLAGCCRIDGQLTRLSFGETEVLCLLLLSHPDRVTSRQDFIEARWPNPDDEPESAGNTYLGVYVSRLRSRGVTIENRYQNFGPKNYGGWRIPREARGRPERVQLVA